MKYDFPINTELYGEICPILSYDEDFLFFTRIGSPDFDHTLIIDSVDVYNQLNEEDYLSTIRRVYKQIESKEVNDVVSSSFNQDIWAVVLDLSKKPRDLFHPEHPINNALPNSICSRFDNHGRFIVINQFDEQGGLDKGFSITQWKNGIFTFPQPLSMEGFHVKSGNVNLTSSTDQSVLILSMPSSSGDMDLYVSERLYEMYYTKPLKILSGVNTEFNEITPSLSSDKKTLFFASDRPESLGGTDIFTATRVGNSYLHWENVTSFLPPVNSKHHEMYPRLFDQSSKLLFSTNRDGSFDIFQASLLREKNIKVILELQIVNGQTQEPMPGELYWGPLYELGKENENYFRFRDGKHTITLTENKPIILKAINRNFSSDHVIFDPQEMWESGYHHKKITLVLTANQPSIIDTREIKLETLPFKEILENNLEEDKKYVSAVFKNIMFEQSTANILPQSLPTIQTLAKFMLANPEILIEIQGHTDNVGDSNALKELSTARAETIKQLLVVQKVENKRISTIGYGAEKPLTDNSTELLRKKNRRVEILILNKED
ncbi:MAG: OmpA family protein [Saprospiraceae bacterium]